MSVLPGMPSLTPELDAASDPAAVPDPLAEAGRYAPNHPAETAMDGSPARRPGDPDPAPRSDAPLFSTDPLGD